MVSFISVTRASDHDHLIGHWRGAVTREGAVQLINISWKRNGKTLGGTIDIPELGMFAEPLKEISYSHPKRTQCLCRSCKGTTMSTDFQRSSNVDSDLPPILLGANRKGSQQLS